MSFRFRVSSLNPSLAQHGSKWSHFSSSAGPSTLLYWRKLAFRDMQASLFYSTQWICLCLYRVVSLLLFTNTQKTWQCLWVVFFISWKANCAICLLSCCLTSFCPFYCCFPFDPLPEKLFFCQKCNSGLWLGVRQGFWCRCESALSLKLPANITGTAAECKDGPLWAQAFHTSELYAWRLVWIAVSECINHIVPHQLDYAGLQLSTFTSLAIANSKPARTRQTCTGFPAVSSGRKEKRCFCGSQPTSLYSDVSPIDFLPQMTDVTVSLCQRSIKPQKLQWSFLDEQYQAISLCLSPFPILATP